MITIEKRDGEKFSKVEMALANLEGMQIYFAMAGFLTSSYINLCTHRINLTVHFDGTRYPKAPKGYMFSGRDIRSHEYYSNYTNEMVRVRTIEYQFEYEE